MALELMATAVGGPGVDPDPLIGAIPFSNVQLTQRRQDRWVAATAPKGGFWRNIRDADTRVGEAMSKILQDLPADPIPALKARITPLYDSLFSPELHDDVQAAAGHKPAEPPPILRLHLSPGGVDIIPWELLWNRVDFLGLQFQVARMPIVPGGPRMSRRAHDVRRISSLLGSQVLDDTQRPDWDATFDTGGNGTVTVWRAPKAVSDWPTVAVLPEASADILHITCHGMLQNGERYWSLDHTKPDDMDVSIYPRDGDNQFQLRKFAPLVFANACSSAAPVIAGTPGLQVLGEGFGATFYDMGASVFIGTLAPVSKRIAVPFATRFFHRLLNEGQSAGEALWSTKQSFAEEGEKDPSWLFYCMYGDPETKFVLAGH